MSIQLSPFSLSSSTEAIPASIERFIAEHPLYAQTAPLDALRAREFTRLDNGDEGAYLDYTGAGLYPECLVKEHVEMMTSKVWGNPHSASPSSQLSSTHTRAARLAILNFFDADPAEYTVVFTSNATNALRLVGESFPFSSSPSEDGQSTKKSRLVLPTDAHNSVHGLREFAIARDAEITYLPIPSTPSELSLDAVQPAPSEHPSLLVLTAQSNLSGFKPPLSPLVAQAKAKGYSVLLDAAALAPTSSISLRSLQNEVDAMAVSIYKITGYPTGVGALVVRKQWVSGLRKVWFSGGSVRIVQAPNMGRLLLDDFERWEDGTINFLSLSAIPRGLQILHGYLAPQLLPSRLAHIMHYTLSSMTSLKHSNGNPVVLVHSPSIPSDSDSYDPNTQGALITLSILLPGSSPSGDARSAGPPARVPPRLVERLAALRNLHVRAGCMCNPGASSAFLGLSGTLNGFELPSPSSHPSSESNPVSEEYMTRPSNEGMAHLIANEGVVRISFGLASNIEDAGKWIGFVRETFVDWTGTAEVDAPVCERVSMGVKEKEMVKMDGSGGVAKRDEARAHIIREALPSDLFDESESVGGSPAPARTIVQTRKEIMVVRLYRKATGRIIGARGVFRTRSSSRSAGEQ